jgi:aspartyl-tRNA synthetase
MPVFGEQEYPEDIRLKYRFLDLRREKLHQNIMTRGAIIDSMRRRMKAQGFFEFQTPILTASSPEGARDFLVPSRIHPGKFYALPQAPQQYKQLLMMSGFDRYFQIAPCFRDEDPRADRLPGEFYQLDVEMSFVEQKDVFEAMEPVITGVFEEFAGGKQVTKRWPWITFTDAIRKYGSDKPDLRNPIVMQNVSDHFRGSGFKVFARLLEDPDNEVWAIPAPEGGSRSFCDRMNSWAQGEGQPGLGYMIIRGGQGTGPIANNLGPERTNALHDQIIKTSEYGGGAEGDAIFFVAGSPTNFARFAGLARNKIGEELNLIDRNKFELAWIVDFPMYGYNAEEKKIEFSHNPFSMPNFPTDEFLALDTAKIQAEQHLWQKSRAVVEALNIKAFQYDIVCNGYEIASGGIRNHRPEAMVKAFEIAGYGEKEVVERFGGMYRAFQYGAPPHGGMAAGVDRIVMLLCGTTNLREISLFPMNQQAVDLLMGAPSEVTPKQLKELSIRLNLP